MEMISSDFAKAIGVSMTTLYNWESDGTLIPARKSPKGRRYYTDEQVQAIRGQDFDNPCLKGGKVGV